MQAFEDMQIQGHRPDVGVYNTLIEVLSRSGSCPATLKAIQLFLAASRQGQFRSFSVACNCLEGCHVYADPVAMLVESIWN